MAKTSGDNETFFSNYPTAPNGVVRTDAPVKAHPIVVAQGNTAGTPITGAIDVGGTHKNTDGVGTRSDKKIS